MERKQFKQILINFGYSDDSVKKIFQGKMVPTLKKAYALEQKHGISIYAWMNIKSYVSSTKSMPDASVHDQVEDPQKSNLKESA